MGLVKDMCGGDRGSSPWDLRLRRRLYEWEEEERISLLNLLNQARFSEEEDRWEWKFSKNGVFSVRSCYKQFLLDSDDPQGHREPFPVNLVWKREIPLKIKVFFWGVVLKRTLSIENLNRRGQSLDPICSRCRLSNETISHILLHCSKSLEVWRLILGEREDGYVRVFAADDVEECLTSWPKARRQDLGGLIWECLPFATCWILWKSRNLKIFHQIDLSAARICSEIKGILWHWMAKSIQRRNFYFKDMLQNWDSVVTENWV
ncbi:hypothetical protein FRX31_025044 [Thalictrum thalictroides]|uniref:Reverse transcriptase zinc-binding domain-containing protein n=1 Tax=Thalictrum thalictroides TaxID=46969 RepID=A0A7J6VM05_THATH|nr:hypothetical protein FRX31_025044 [Thalictrum thalictroides]